MIKFGVLKAWDFGPFGELSLPLGDQGLVLIQGDNRDSTAADSNGVGKSHVFKAISWGLFGTTIEGDKGSDLIRRGAKRAEVRVPFTDGRHEYEVVREQGRGGGLKLFRDGAEASGITIKDTQDEIHKLLGMDFLTFRNTCYYGQNDGKRFGDSDTPDAERKAVAKRIFRLEVMDAAQKLAKARRDSAASRARVAELELPSVETKLGLIDLDAIKESIEEREKAKAVKDKKASKRKRLEKSINSIRELLAGYAEKQEEIKKQEAKRQSLVEKISERRSKVSVAESRAKDRREALAEFDDGLCPTCGTPADSEHVSAKVAGLRKGLKEAEKEASAGQAEIGRLRAERATLDEGLEALKSDVGDEQDWRDQLAGLRAELRSIDEAAEEAANIDKEITKLKAELKEAEASQRSLSARAAKLRSDIEEARDEERHADFWVKGFGNAGLPSYILDGMVPDLTERANHYLRILTDGDITVRYDTQSELKSGAVRDKFDVILDVEGAGNVRPSGGQGRKVTLATDLALMDLVASRERAAIDFLGLDEVLDGLDAAGRSRVLDLLVELRKNRSTILVISHDPAIAELFEKAPTVVKEGGVARLVA